MALRLISTLSILVLASFAYKVWDKTKVPEDVSAEDVWKVKTIEFVCRIVSNIAFHRELDGVPVIMFRKINLGSAISKEQSPPVEPKAVVIYFHGGGWVWLDAEDPMPTLHMITQELHIDTISVEYRLAPEFVYPAGLEDCVTVTNYVVTNHKELGVDPDKIIVAGDSAGGNLAAAVALRLKHKVRLQVLIYPVLQAFDFQTPSYREKNGVLKYILSPSSVIECVLKYGAVPQHNRQALYDNTHISQSTRKSRYSSYVHSSLIPTEMNITKLGTLPSSSVTSSEDVQEVERVALDPYFMPLMAESLDDVADAYIVTAQHDLLRDDGLFYTARIKNTSNVKVKLNNYRDGFHAFFHFSQGPLKLKSAQKAVNDLIRFIDDNVIKAA